jgi:hypothetical protein
MNKIIIAYHAYLNGPHWHSVVGEQFVKLLASGIMDNCDRLHIGITDNSGLDPSRSVEWVQNWFANTRHPEKVDSVVYNENNELTDTMKWVRDYSKDNPGDCVLFFHTKGISHYDLPTEDWRRYMEWFTIWQWRECIEKLKNYDCCGVMWNSETVWGYYPHFSGAFWWATTDYINTLDHSYLEKEWKYYREFWIGSNPEVNAFEFHNSRMNDIAAFIEGRSHYSVRYPIENYVKTVNTLVELNKENGVFLTDKGSVHNYLQFYDLLFRKYRNDRINIFEVGYQYGGSCELWKRYFTFANIKAIDIKLWGPSPDRDNYNLYNEFIVPSGRVSLDFINIQDLPLEYFDNRRPDIAIDDGSHTLEDQIKFIKTVYPVLNHGGILIVEDIQDYDNQLVEFNKLGIKFVAVDNRDSGVYDDVFIYFTKPETWQSR